MTLPNERYYMILNANTEIWTRSTGKVAKMVVRNTNGTFAGVTNQTREIPIGKVVRPRVTLRVK